MDFSFPSLMAGLLFGVVGMWLVKRSRNKGNMLNALVGVVLIVYPYFIANIGLNCAIGVALCFMAWKLD